MPNTVRLSDNKRPLFEGRVHFIRRVSKSGIVRVLNVDWQVPRFDPLKGVWVTLELKVQGATLSIFDSAPDADTRQCLASYPFLLKEAVQPRPGDQTLSLTEADSKAAFDLGSG